MSGLNQATFAILFLGVFGGLILFAVLLNCICTYCVKGKSTWSEPINAAAHPIEMDTIIDE